MTAKCPDFTLMPSASKSQVNSIDILNIRPGRGNTAPSLSSQKTEKIEIAVRPANTVYQASGRIQDGTFRGRWHFSFDMYSSPRYNNFGNLRVLNDDTLSPGAVWPLHPHTQNEVVTYVAEGEFRHEDERGKGGVLHKGGVQHTTVGRGMYHSEIKNRKDITMRIIQIWYMTEMLYLDTSLIRGE